MDLEKKETGARMLGTLPTAQLPAPPRYLAGPVTGTGCSLNPIASDVNVLSASSKPERRKRKRNLKTQKK